MKRSLLLFGCLLLTKPVFSKVGTHNFVIKTGGGFAASMIIQTGESYGKVIPSKSKYYELLGGVVAVDLGYQFFSTYKNVVQGIDTLIGFGINFDYVVAYRSYKIEDVQILLQRLYGYLSSTYTVGRQFHNTKLMFDILGINLSVGETTFGVLVKEGSISYPRKNEGIGSYFGIGVNLPLGIQIVVNNGFVFGFRHSLNFLFPLFNNKNGMNFLTPVDLSTGIKFTNNYVNYNLIISLGYMFGK